MELELEELVAKAGSRLDGQYAVVTVVITVTVWRTQTWSLRAKGVAKVDAVKASSAAAKRTRLDDISEKVWKSLAKYKLTENDT